MPFCQWDDKNWKALIHSIKHNKCILMLGPDVPCEMVQGQPLPLTELLANELAKKIDKEAREKINTSDLAQVAQYFERDRNYLEAEVTNFYGQREDLCSDIYRNLAALPFYLTVTTTPDFMFRKALEKEGKIPITEGYYFKRPEMAKSMVEKMGTVENPMIFYLYGTLDEPGSLVLTENDILDFLVGLISKNPSIPENVLRELRDESKSFLFLGFGFRNWYLRILLYVLNGRNKESSSFAMEQFIPQYKDLFKQSVFFFQKSDYKIHIFKKDFNDFAALLREKCKEIMQGPIPTLKPPLMPQKSPLVFICHVSEDEESATFLYQEFKNADLDPWLDKSNLMGGDEWDKEIKRILKVADYFVVVHSKKLAARPEGYVFREIDFALERKPDFRKGIRFIIPIQIDDTPLIEDLEKFQSVDLTDKKNINNLIYTIKRDFKIREGYEKQS